MIAHGLSLIQNDAGIQPDRHTPQEEISEEFRDQLTIGGPNEDEAD
jgi:hypothetical protein